MHTTETTDLVRLQVRRKFNTSEVIERLEIICESCGLVVFSGDQGTVDTIELDAIFLRAAYNHQHQIRNVKTELENHGSE